MAKKYWLMKSEPHVYSIDQLKADKTTLWEGVRNYQARNFMMKEMQPGDGVLFYHSNAKPSGVAGLAQVSKGAVPDPSQFQKKGEYFDPKATQENPRWHCVEVAYGEKFPHFVPLGDLKSTKALEGMAVIQKGQRLSIQPLSLKHFKMVCKMGGL